MNNTDYNFLPFELVKLLPRRNLFINVILQPIYKNGELCAVDKENHLKIDIDNFLMERAARSNDLEEIKFLKEFTHNTDDYRDSWTIIQALTWLEKQRYVVEALMFSYNTDCSEWKCNITNLKSEHVYNIETIYNSRVEAYIASIKYCLELLNQNESNKTSSITF